MKIGLDIAKEWALLCWPWGQVGLTQSQLNCTAQEQYNFLYGFSWRYDRFDVYVEKLNHFVNANTTRSLLLRTGYIVGSLEIGCVMLVCNRNPTRKYQGKNKT